MKRSQKLFSLSAMNKGRLEKQFLLELVSEDYTLVQYESIVFKMFGNS